MVAAEMFTEGTPCAVKLANSSFRRALTTANASTECPVLLVDSGESAYVRTENMRQLLLDFAELPPLAVQCQLEGAHRDILYGSIINQFHCKCKPKQRFKLSIVGQLEDRLVVHLFDSEMNDLFDLYFGPLLRKNEMAKKQRELAIASGLCKKEKKRTSDSDDDDDDDEEFLFDDEDEELITYTNS
ncbi:hypothetical protein D918_02448 [Trichuris suis]|nr:hypothetical protein D918_02448 [Trichuris suis]